MAPPKLQQYAAAGHVLGFTAGAVYVATGSHALRVEFVNAKPVGPVSDQPGGDAGRGDARQAAPALTEVRYPGLWPGIDLSYRAAPGGIAESVWTVAPGADLGQARLRYNRPLALDQDGRLQIRYPDGMMTESAPRAWQEQDGRRLPVAVAFALHGERELGFTLGAHEPGLPVQIDPTLTWNTFLGGSGNDLGYGIAVDSSGNVYVAGTSNTSWGSPLQAFGGGVDAFAAKLDSSGARQWHTFLGVAVQRPGTRVGNGAAARPARRSVITLAR